MGNSDDKIQEQNSFSIDNVKFKQIKDLFCLEDEHISEFYQFYRKIDQENRSYIDLDNFVRYLKRYQDNFVELPYAQKLFDHMQVEKEGKVFFEEFVRGISAFCLLNNQSLLHFTFDLIDNDGDQRISKKDITKLVEYQDPQTGEFTFFTNFLLDLERFKMKENQTKMDFDYFRLNSEKFLFLTWPAFSLQEIFRQNVLGGNFWNELYAKAQKKEAEIKSNEKKQLKLRQKVDLLKILKMKKNNGPFIKQNFHQRGRKEVADDCKLIFREPQVRRNSFIYIKNDIHFKTNEENDQQ